MKGYNVTIDGELHEYGDGPEAFAKSLRAANNACSDTGKGNVARHEVTWRDGDEVITHTPIGIPVKGNA